ncbi:cation:proton antiporter [Chromatiales bacterium (ex Bugula neritina AB1)]|nr:cation:proton antiporter [Chromatiales bacterium (ex Bugula neritina AB1)]
MNAPTILLLCLIIPLCGGVLLAMQNKSPNTRDTISLVTGVSLFAAVLSLYPAVLAGNSPQLILAEPVKGLSFSLQVEPLGLLFATVASGLWILTTVYGMGYMRGNGEVQQTRFFFCFAISISAAMGIAFAGNLFTLFLFYEMLTLSTYPLVTHKGNEDARRGGRIYLGILMFTSIGFLLFATLWTYSLAGTLDFRAGGILKDHVTPTTALILLTLFAFGTGKAALMPFHRWLPAAMVAPTPVSALLHAVAVVKAGVFTVLKITIYIFGIDLVAETGAGDIALWTATFTLTVASLVALTKNNLKARLAYSTIGQLSYVIVGAMLANAAGIIGATMQIAMHAMGKITLFFCAGAIYVATHKTEISDMRGLGYRMPFTFAAFFIGSISIIGLPPLGGSWAKWHLLLGSLEASQWIIVGALLLSSLLNIAYLIPVAARAFYLTPEQKTPTIQVAEAPMLCVVPLCITAAGTFLLFMFGDALNHLVTLIPLRAELP